jgi:hypothetical protein
MVWLVSKVCWVATGIEGKVWPVSKEGRLQQELKVRSGLFQRKADCNRNRREVWPVPKEGR